MKLALVTGGTKGIGKAIALKLLEQGYSVILNYCSDDNNANKIFNEFSLKWPGKVFLLKENLSLIDNVYSFCRKVREISLKIDVIIFNAGKTNRAPFHEISIDDWNDVMNTNVTVPVFILKELFLNLNPRASIIFVSSAMSVYPHSLSISYGVSKSAVNSLVLNLVKFLSPKLIRVNAILPGFVETDWQKEKPHEIRKNIENKISLNRFSKPEEIADACYFLIRNEYMTGELLKIDGGYCTK
jgi:3-oxoacyl-[acyl-carrier protein] reductase